jgi:hypothetical protein
MAHTGGIRESGEKAHEDGHVRISCLLGPLATRSPVLLWDILSCCPISGASRISNVLIRNSAPRMGRDRQPFLSVTYLPEAGLSEWRKGRAQDPTRVVYEVL